MRRCAGQKPDVSSDPAFEAVFATVYEPLQRYLRRRVDAETADDVLGEVVIVLWRRRSDIPAHQPLPWCYGVARRCLANAIRGSERRLRLVRRLEVEASRPTTSGYTVLDDALALQSPDDRELLRLWAWEQLTSAEIAQVLGITSNAASIRLHRAVKKVKKALEPGKTPVASGHSQGRQGEEAR